MPLIERKIAVNKDKIKTEISKDILNEMSDYMKWANIDDISYFLEEAALIVFKNDREWKKHKKEIKLEKA